MTEEDMTPLFEFESYKLALHEQQMTLLIGLLARKGVISKNDASQFSLLMADLVRDLATHPVTIPFGQELASRYENAARSFLTMED